MLVRPYFHVESFIRHINDTTLLVAGVVCTHNQPYLGETSTALMRLCDDGRGQLGINFQDQPTDIMALPERAHVESLGELARMPIWPNCDDPSSTAAFGQAVFRQTVGLADDPKGLNRYAFLSAVRAPKQKIDAIMRLSAHAHLFLRSQRNEGLIIGSDPIALTQDSACPVQMQSKYERIECATLGNSVLGLYHLPVWRCGGSINYSIGDLDTAHVRPLRERAALHLWQSDHGRLPTQLVSELRGVGVLPPSESDPLYRTYLQRLYQRSPQEPHCITGQNVPQPIAAIHRLLTIDEQIAHEALSSAILVELLDEQDAQFNSEPATERPKVA